MQQKYYFNSVQGKGVDNANANIQTQNNYFSNPQKALKLGEEPHKFTVRKNILGKQDFLYSLTILFVTSFFVALILFSWAKLGSLGISPMQAFLAVLITVFCYFLFLAILFLLLLL